MKAMHLTRGIAMAAALTAAIALVPSLHAGAEPGGQGSGGHSNPPGAAVLAQVGSQVERGRAVFAANCATCHGAQGQGTSDGPRLIGSPNDLSSHGTAAKLYDFVKANMPVGKEGSLRSEEYCDVLAFILDGNKLLPPDITLGSDTAERVRLTP